MALLSLGEYAFSLDLASRGLPGTAPSATGFLVCAVHSLRSRSVIECRPLVGHEEIHFNIAPGDEDDVQDPLVAAQSYSTRKLLQHAFRFLQPESPFLLVLVPDWPVSVASPVVSQGLSQPLVVHTAHVYRRREVPFSSNSTLWYAKLVDTLQLFSFHRVVRTPPVEGPVLASLGDALARQRVLLQMAERESQLASEALCVRLSNALPVGSGLGAVYDGFRWNLQATPRDHASCEPHVVLPLHALAVVGYPNTGLDRLVLEQAVHTHARPPKAVTTHRESSATLFVFAHMRDLLQWEKTLVNQVLPDKDAFASALVCDTEHVAFAQRRAQTMRACFVLASHLEDMRDSARELVRQKASHLVPGTTPESGRAVVDLLWGFQHEDPITLFDVHWKRVVIVDSQTPFAVTQKSLARWGIRYQFLWYAVETRHPRRCLGALPRVLVRDADHHPATNLYEETLSRGVVFAPVPQWRARVPVVIHERPSSDTTWFWDGVKPNRTSIDLLYSQLCEAAAGPLCRPMGIKPVTVPTQEKALEYLKALANQSIGVVSPPQQLFFPSSSTECPVCCEPAHAVLGRCGHAFCQVCIASLGKDAPCAVCDRSPLANGLDDRVVVQTTADADTDAASASGETETATRGSRQHTTWVAGIAQELHDILATSRRDDPRAPVRVQVVVMTKRQVRALQKSLFSVLDKTPPNKRDGPRWKLAKQFPREFEWPFVEEDARPPGRAARSAPVLHITSLDDLLVGHVVEGGLFVTHVLFATPLVRPVARTPDLCIILQKVASQFVGTHVSQRPPQMIVLSDSHPVSQSLARHDQRVVEETLAPSRDFPIEHDRIWQFGTPTQRHLVSGAPAFQQAGAILVARSLRYKANGKRESTKRRVPWTLPSLRAPCRPCNKVSHPSRSERGPSPGEAPAARRHLPFPCQTPILPSIWGEGPPTCPLPSRRHHARRRPQTPFGLSSPWLSCLSWGGSCTRSGEEELPKRRAPGPNAPTRRPTRTRSRSRTLTRNRAPGDDGAQRAYASAKEPRCTQFPRWRATAKWRDSGA